MLPRADRSTNILTGVIIAALYVILLVGFVRESYTYRHAVRIERDRGILASTRGATTTACRVELSLCAPEQVARSREIWRAMRDDP
jgi:hypothetical protein